MFPLFRGKTKEGKWVEGYYVNKAFGQENIIFGKDDSYPYRVIPESVGMSTGLKDKNGKEIFGSIPINGEMSKGGDIIIQEHSYAGTHKGDIWYRAELGNAVGWMCGQFYMSSMQKSFEVIGNQFDNPELLE